MKQLLVNRSKNTVANVTASCRISLQVFFSLGIFNLSESFNASMAMLESLRVVRPAIANSALM